MNNLEPLFGEDGPGERPLVIAGPCSAESREQTLRTASELKEGGIRFFRAGLWKPRTKPGSFEGVGSRGLPWLSEVRQRLGMAVATEVATAAHVRLALGAGLDAFWIGARTSANPFAVQEIADVLAALPAARREAVTVLVKNPVNPDLELWIGALQRIYAAGIRRLGAVHRGFSAYGEHLYRNRPEWRIPIELRRRFPQLPLICDPSHIGGRRDLIQPISQQALDMDFDGLIIESHCRPDCALSDSGQQVTPGQLAEILGHLHIRSGHGAAESLRIYREEIDRIDTELVSLLARRMGVSAEIGRLKLSEGLPVIQPERYNDLMERRVAEAARMGLPEQFMRTLFGTIHEESVRRQLELGNESVTEPESKDN